MALRRYELITSLVIFKTYVLTAVDRRGESEESGDDETKRKSINGEADPQQPSTGDNLP